MTNHTKSKVALVKGDSRYDSISRALALIADDVRLEAARRVLIKPNFVSVNHPLAITHADAVRAVLDFVRARYDGPLTIGEGAALGDTFDGFRRFGYVELAARYDARLVDLNNDEWVEVEVFDRRLRPMRARLARTVADSDYRISVGPPKTHDTVIVTASLKNMIVGSMIRPSGDGDHRTQLHQAGTRLPAWLRGLPALQGLRLWARNRLQPSDKIALHQGYHGLNLNLYTLAKRFAPHLSVIDGWVAMEGQGPIDGDPVELRLAIVSTDFLAADTVATTIMGFDVDTVGYLHLCKLGRLGAGDLAGIEIVGNATVEECVRPFKPHSSHQRQLKWQIPNVSEFL